MKLEGFDATQQGEMRTFEPMPLGRYLAMIVNSEERLVQDKPGKPANGASYLWLEIQIVEGQYQGRKLSQNLNLNNPNEQTVQIARAELGAICKAVGVTHPGDSAELHNLPFCIDLKISKRQDTGELQNKITAYHNKAKLNEARFVPQPPRRVGTAATAGASTATATEPGKAPWAR